MHSISGFFRNEVRSLKPCPLAPIRPTRILSFAETGLLDDVNAFNGKTLPAARTDAV
jgi:hypothetical protein